MNEFHEANRKGWDAVSPSWQAKIDAQGSWRQAATDPTVVFDPLELSYLGDVKGKQVCVLGSGDNLVAFALAGMGAQVTSVDISQTQLNTAAERARSLGLTLTFVRADVTDLAPLAANIFDLVYTGGHVAVWVADLNKYYAEAGRILKPGGLFIVNEYHPFRRIWKWGSDHLEVETPYFNRGPHQFDRAAEAGSQAALPSYEFHWTIADFVAALQASGCTLVALHEFGEQAEDWEATPLAGLPQCLLLIGKKHGA